MRRPGYLVTSTQAITASRQRTPYDYLKVLHNWLNVTAHVEQARRQAAVTLFDQGPYQALWSIGYSAGVPDLADLTTRLGRRMPRPDMLVLVEADAETVLTRLTERGANDSRLDPARSGITTVGDLARPQSLLDQVADYATLTAPLIRLDNSAPDSLRTNSAHLVRTICEARGQP